jgi:hypothetical protein
MKKPYYLVVCLLLVNASCTKKTYTSDRFIKKQRQIIMSAAYTIPANTGCTDHALKWGLQTVLHIDSVLELNDTDHEKWIDVHQN